MKETKRMVVSGLAFDIKWKTPFFTIRFGENVDMERLSKKAKEGWITTGFGLTYRLEKGEPKDTIYAIDYKDSVALDYFEHRAASGWHHIDSNAHIHLFQAEVGTPPLVSNLDSKIAILANEAKRFEIGAIFSVLLLAIASIFFALALRSDAGGLMVTAFVFMLGTYVMSVFTVLPMIGYRFRVRRLKKNKI